jgi:plastocyanin
MAAALLLGLPFLHADAAEPKQSASDLKQPAHGKVEGFVTFRGEIPKSSTPDDAGVRRDLLDVDRKTGGLRHVLVYLTRTNAPAPSTATPARKPVVDQQNHEFTPRVIAVQQGQSILFSNSDPANHNVRTTASVKENEFNVFTSVDGKYEHRFVIEPAYRPIRLGCDIHPWMRGWVFVFDHPNFAVTDERGAFRIDSVPPGEYKLMIQQPDIRYARHRNVTVSIQEPTKIKIEIRVENLSQPKD